MRVRVLFFGRLREIVGRAEEDTEVQDGARVEDLFARYGQSFPELAGFRGSVVAAINQGLAGWQSQLANGDEVAFLPPVSGGAGPSTVAPNCTGKGGDVVAIVRDPIRVAEIVASLKGPEDGAVAAFEGIVRNRSAGRHTLYLEYEAYEPMARAKLRDIVAAMRAGFPVDGVALVHRLGRLEIGETSVLVAVSSAHRDAAFKACRMGIDTLKLTVPIWKKEYFEGGAVWAEGEILSLPSNSRPTESIP